MGMWIRFHTMHTLHELYLYFTSVINFDDQESAKYDDTNIHRTPASQQIASDTKPAITEPVIN
jgi:hypothetical protein